MSATTLRTWPLNLLPVLLAGSILAAGCGDDTDDHDHDHGGAGHGHHRDGGIGPDDVEVPVIGLTKQGQNEALEFELLDLAPAPPEKGFNTWTVAIRDADGEPVADAHLRVVPFMPEHGHGTSTRAEVTSDEAGSYVIHPLNMFMGDRWTVTIFVCSEDEQPRCELTSDSFVDRVVFETWIHD